MKPKTDNPWKDPGSDIMADMEEEWVLDPPDQPVTIFCPEEQAQVLIDHSASEAIRKLQARVQELESAIRHEAKVWDRYLGLRLQSHGLNPARDQSIADIRNHLISLKKKLGLADDD